MSINFKSEEEVQEFIKNLGIEYRFGCYKENKPEVCHLLGDYLEAIDKDYEKAGKIYQNNCDSHSFAKSCLKFGNYLALGKGIKKPDTEKALTYFDKGCKLGEMSACYRAGILNILDNGTGKPKANKDLTQGIKYLETSCNSDYPEACYHLSGIYMDGFEQAKILKDMKRSYEYALKACNLNHMYACANVSLMYKKGDGVAVDLELSQKYKTKAIELQDELKQQQTLTFQEGISPT